LLHEAALRLPGRFNVRNAAGGLAAALALGAAPHGAALAVAAFAGLPHRMASLGHIAGVLYVDNGVSTVLESTTSALDALGGRVHWVGGGRPKGPDLASFAEHIAPRVTSAHLFGEVAARLGPLIGGRRTDLPVTVSRTLEEALEHARAAARGGDTVLFSPGFSSYDQFANFKERAAAAGRWVETSRLAGGRSADRVRTGCAT
jgi:UDP-N-acetylmuramoylalanine--D-glutamate ligase